MCHCRTIISTPCPPNRSGQVARLPDVLDQRPSSRLSPSGCSRCFISLLLQAPYSSSVVSLFSCILCSTYLSILFDLPHYSYFIPQYLSILLYVVFYRFCCILYIVLYCFLLFIYLLLYFECNSTECNRCYDDLISPQGLIKSSIYLSIYL